MKRIYILALKVKDLYVSRRNNVVSTYETYSYLTVCSCFLALSSLYFIILRDA